METMDMNRTLATIGLAGALALIPEPKTLDLSRLEYNGVIEGKKISFEYWRNIGGEDYATAVLTIENDKKKTIYMDFMHDLTLDSIIEGNMTLRRGETNTLPAGQAIYDHYIGILRMKARP